MITEIIVGVLVAIIVGASTLGLDAYRKRPYVKRITDPNDNDFEVFYDLYERLIPDDERDPMGELARYLEEDNMRRSDPNREFEEYFIVAKKEDLVIGFLYFTYYNKRGYAMINYFGVDKSILDARRYASSTIMKKLRILLRKNLRNCKGIFFEIDTPRPELSQSQNRKRQSRRQLFERYAKMSGYKAHEIPIQYVQPTISIREGYTYAEVPMTLMYIPIRDSHVRLAKNDVIEMLKFVYFDWYGDVYETDAELNEKYMAYLSSLVDRYKRNLPEEVLLKN